MIASQLSRCARIVYFAVSVNVKKFIQIYLIQELLFVNYHEANNAALSFMTEFIALNLVETKRTTFTGTVTLQKRTEPLFAFLLLRLLDAII